MKVLMVCLGNICRSPLAQGILEHNAQKMGLTLTVDSAGTSAHHIGERPDPRSISIAGIHGIDITHQRARQFVVADFDRFDIIFVMDQSNYRDVIRLANATEQKQKVRRILDVEHVTNLNEVPDPYYGGDEGFKKVYDMLNRATLAFLQHNFNK
jgi:protein-tyrosine phosphatase